MVALLAAASLILAAPAPAVRAENAVELPIVRELNRVRSEHGLALLRTARPLRLAADAHAASMARLGFFSHTSADGTTFDRRIGRFYRVGRSSYWAVGENLLWASPAVSPEEAVRMWMASRGHRRNILNTRYRQIGISAVRVAQAPGFFGGREVTVVVTDFGVRR